MTMFNYERDGEVDTFKVGVHLVLGVIVLILGLGIIFGSFGRIASSERGVQTRFGKVTGVVQPGLYFKVPFIDEVHVMDVQARTINYDKNGNEGDAIDTSQLSGASEDLQEVKIGVVVNYKIDPDKVSDIFVQYKSVDNYEYNIIETAIRKLVKTIAGQYTAEELVTKRLEYNDRVSVALEEEFRNNYAILVNSNITNFEFSPSFTEAIEAKVTAVQNAEAQKNKLEQVKYEAQQKIESAKAEAESIRIQAQAITQQGGADYVKLQAIAKWKGEVPQYMMGNAVPFIDLK